MSIDAAVENFRKEFPYWRWNGGVCGLSAHVCIAPDDWTISDEMRAFDERFNSGFDVELEHDNTGIRCISDALEAAMKEARAACDAWLAHSGKDARA